MSDETTMDNNNESEPSGENQFKAPWEPVKYEFKETGQDEAVNTESEPVTESQPVPAAEPEPVPEPQINLAGAKPRVTVTPEPRPMRIVFGDMAGAFFLCWLPILAAFFLPWELWFGNLELFAAKGLNLQHLIVAGVIAIPPWIVLMIHLFKGRMWDGVLDMLLWALWECGLVIILCYLYPEQAKILFWNSGEYFEEMTAWLSQTGGVEGDPAKWMPLHGLHLGLVSVGGFLLGLPGLLMGVLQLNYMNYYVARMMLASDNPLITLPVAWHFWSIIRVAGFIIIATAFFQCFIKLVFRVRGSWSGFWSGIGIGLLLVIIDALLKWQYAEPVRQALSQMTGY